MGAILAAFDYPYTLVLLHFATKISHFFSTWAEAGAQPSRLIDPFVYCLQLRQAASQKTVSTNFPIAKKRPSDCLILDLLLAQDPYSYSDGRWLHRDELQRRLRYLRFDFALLCELAVNACDGASKVAEYEKMEGGYNRLFILTMDTGKRVIARIPTPVAGPPRLTTNSEVATITYCIQFYLSLTYRVLHICSKASIDYAVADFFCLQYNQKPRFLSLKF